MAQNVNSIDNVSAILQELRSQIADLTGRVARLEAGVTPNTPAVTAAVETPKPLALLAPVKQEITEEEILAVSAALGAYLGVRVHIRQIRLLSSSAWAQQGRVSVQAHISHMH
jgi:methylmalonyl-CoA carboxyltransferase large subunit